MTKELVGKTAFVTGSGRGLGRMMAERSLNSAPMSRSTTSIGPRRPNMARRRSRRGGKEIARHGGRVCAVSGNIGDKGAVAR